MNRTELPRYAHLAQLLSRQIQEGEFDVGALLPTEALLCERHGVSRITVRGALRQLESQGLISRTPRVGTRVLARTPQAVFTHDGDSIDGVLKFTQALPFRCLGMQAMRLDPRRARRECLPPGRLDRVARGARTQPRCSRAAQHPSDSWLAVCLPGGC